MGKWILLILKKKVTWHIREHRPVVTVRGKNEVGSVKVVARHLSTACNIYTIHV